MVGAGGQRPITWVFWGNGRFRRLKCRPSSVFKSCNRDRHGSALIGPGAIAEDPRMADTARPGNNSQDTGSRVPPPGYGVAIARFDGKGGEASSHCPRARRRRHAVLARWNPSAPPRGRDGLSASAMDALRAVAEAEPGRSRPPLKAKPCGDWFRTRTPSRRRPANACRDAGRRAAAPQEGRYWRTRNLE